MELQTAVGKGRIKAAILALLTVGGVVTADFAAAQVPAFLPGKAAIAETETLPIDGVWTVSTIGKRIRIERGRAYAVDSWLHLFVLKVLPDMVVMRNFRRVAAGHYEADDLPLAGPATMHLTPDGNISVYVKGALGPVSYALIRGAIDDQLALDGEISALTGTPPPGLPDYRNPPAQDSSPSTPPDGSNPLADCRELGVDSATGNIVCLD